MSGRESQSLVTRKKIFSRQILIFAAATILTAALVGVILKEISVLLRLILILVSQVIVTIFFLSYANKRNKEKREQAIEQKTRNTRHDWWKHGLFFGGFLYISLNIILPLVLATEYDISIFLNSLPVALIAGLFFGLGMKMISRNKRV